MQNLPTATEQAIEPLQIAEKCLDSPILDIRSNQATSKASSVHQRHGYLTPPQSATSEKSSFSPSVQDVSVSSSLPSPRCSSEISASNAPLETGPVHGSRPGRRRGSSLAAHFPGDTSHRPLNMLRTEQKIASRPRRRTLVGVDTIDQLDQIGANGVPYHHDGPYDATLLARNLSFKSSPVAATQNTNQEAIQATPIEFINDSLQKHRPLLGTATIPPGVEDSEGRVLEYAEGPNLNIEMGWRRWKGLKYHPDDIKGKGEPSFSLERALKENKSHRRIASDGGIEMQTRVGSFVGTHTAPTEAQPLQADEKAGEKAQDTKVNISFYEGDTSQAGGLHRAHTTGRRTSAMASTLKSKFGSLRRRRAGDKTL